MYSIFSISILHSLRSKRLQERQHIKQPVIVLSVLTILVAVSTKILRCRPYTNSFNRIAFRKEYCGVSFVTQPNYRRNVAADQERIIAFTHEAHPRRFLDQISPARFAASPTKDPALQRRRSRRSRSIRQRTNAMMLGPATASAK